MFQIAFYHYIMLFVSLPPLEAKSQVLWSLCDDLYADRCAWKLRNRWYGVSPADPSIVFHTALFAGNRLDKQREFVIRGSCLSLSKLSLNNGRSKELLIAVEKHRPVWILAQPSIMKLLWAPLLTAVEHGQAFHVAKIQSQF